MEFINIELTNIEMREKILLKYKFLKYFQKRFIKNIIPFINGPKKNMAIFVSWVMQ